MILCSAKRWLRTLKTNWPLGIFGSRKNRSWTTSAVAPFCKAKTNVRPKFVINFFFVDKFSSRYQTLECEKNTCVFAACLTEPWEPFGLPYSDGGGVDPKRSESVKPIPKKDELWFFRFFTFQWQFKQNDNSWRQNTWHLQAPPPVRD